MTEIVFCAWEFTFSRTPLFTIKEIEFESDSGKMLINNTFKYGEVDHGTELDFYQYVHNKLQYFCFSDEEQITEFKKIIEGDNLKCTVRTEGDYYFTDAVPLDALQKTRETIQIYESLNEDIYNILK